MRVEYVPYEEKNEPQTWIHPPTWVQSKNLVFIPINKCGGTAISRALADRYGREDAVLLLPGWPTPDPQKTQHVAMIREPVDRLCSAFAYMQARWPQYCTTLFEHITAIPYREKKDPHFVPQTQWLAGVPNLTVVPWSFPAMEVLLDAPIPRKNSTPRSWEPTNEERELIYELYENDVSLWRHVLSEVENERMRQDMDACGEGSPSFLE